MTSSGLRLLAGICSCLALTLALVSCSSYQLVGAPDRLASQGTEKGTEVRVHPVDALPIEDTFVQVTPDTLFCESHRFAVASVRFVEQRGFDEYETFGLAFLGALVLGVVVQIKSQGF